MSGSLGEWSIEDLLQIARITHKTTCVEIRGPQVSGAIFLRDGAVVDALVDDGLRGGGSRFSQVVEAIEVLSATEDGSFEFSSRSAPEVSDRPIEVPAITAAMEKDTLREKRLADLGVDNLESLAIGRHIEGPMSIKPAVWQLLADLVDSFSLEMLQARMGRRKAVATLLTLDALGVLERHGEALVPVGPTDRESSPPERAPAPEMSSEPGEDEEVEDVLFEPLAFEDPSATDPPSAFDETQTEESPPPLPDDQDSWISSSAEPPDAAAQEGSAADPDEPIVEIFEPIDDPDGDHVEDEPPMDMHEVVTPSETTLVSDVLGDMRSRFREREYVYEDEGD
jgi:hypothetical protein